MGAKTKVAAVILAMTALLLVGCENQPLPPPTIQINESDSSNFTVVTVIHENLYYSQQEDPHVILSTPEEVAAYKEQVEFLLNRLDEVERRMNIHEPE